MKQNNIIQLLRKKITANPDFYIKPNYHSMVMTNKNTFKQAKQSLQLSDSLKKKQQH